MNQVMTQIDDNIRSKNYDAEVCPHKWITVKDRLPDQDGRYLIVEIGLYIWVGVCSLRQGQWDSQTVTHWMPLPEAPI